MKIPGDRKLLSDYDGGGTLCNNHSKAISDFSTEQEVLILQTLHLLSLSEEVSKLMVNKT